MAKDEISYGQYVPVALQKHLNEKVLNGKSGLYERLAHQQGLLTREEKNLNDAISDKQPDGVMAVLRDRVRQHQVVTDMLRHDFDQWSQLLSANDRGFAYLKKHFANDVSLSKTEQMVFTYRVLRSIHYAYSADFNLIISARDTLDEQAECLEQLLPTIKSALRKIDSNIGLTLAAVPVEKRVTLELYTEIIDCLYRDVSTLIDVQDPYFDAALKIGRSKKKANFSTDRLRLALSFILKYIDVQTSDKSLLSAIKHSIDAVSEKPVAVRSIQRQLENF